jgi:CRISPR-associated Csx2 family protein
MTHHLLSFVGKATEYKEADYRFPDNRVLKCYTVFGHALLEWIRDAEYPVEQATFLGTKGSNFGALIPLADRPAGSALHDLYHRVQDAAEENTVDKSLLAKLQEPLGKALGLPVRLRLIPTAETSEEQIEVVRELADGIQRQDLVTLDVTHSLRHLPMLTMTAALMLRHVRQAMVDHIYYGAFDLARARGEVPVIDLSGVLGVANWLAAFAVFERAGDFGPFAEALRNDGVPGHDHLAAAAALERTTRLSATGAAIAHFEDDAGQDWRGLSGLFKADLSRELMPFRSRDLYANQRALALHHLRAGRARSGDASPGDILRAAIFVYEALTTRLIRHNASRFSELNGIDRMVVWRSYSTRADLNEVKNLRNALAHGDEARYLELESLLNNAADLKKRLAELLATFIPEWWDEPL